MSLPALLLPSPIEVLDDERLAAAGVRVLLKRDDLIHPDLPGNKWRKLIAFVDDFEARHGLRLDWVYVAKMMYGVFDLVEQGRLAAGARVVAVISGPDFEVQTRS